MPQPFAQDRLIRKETALGFIRERSFPEGHIILPQIAPFQNVNSDDAIFEYVQVAADGLAPARSQDAESELAYKEETFGLGRASIVDWAIKDHYDPSDVYSYNEAIFLQGRLGSELPIGISGNLEDFQARLARDTALRRKKLDNRLEWLGQQALWTNGIAYNDGKVIFNVTYNRPTAQNNGMGASGASVTPWDTADADPVGDTIAIQHYMLDTYGVDINRCLISTRILRSIVNSHRFAARVTGLAIAGSSTATTTPIDPRYFGFDPKQAAALFENLTGVTPIVYDSVFWTRTEGSTTRTVNRYSPSDKVLFLPSEASVNDLDDAIGFGKTLTSPHPEGNWTPGYYEWEKDTGPDPWGYDVGAGIKAFPVFPHLDLSYLLNTNLTNLHP